MQTTSEIVFALHQYSVMKQTSVYYYNPVSCQND